MKWVLPLPTLLTLGNFSCGLIAVIFCIHSERLSASVSGSASRSEELLAYAGAMVFLGMIFDVLDGRVARMTRRASKFGGELDSLADCCSFGVAPAIIVTTVWIQVQPASAKWYGQVMACGLVYAACAVLRLARYNVEAETADKNYFAGLPSPAAAGAAVSAVLFARSEFLQPFWTWGVDLLHLGKGTATAAAAGLLQARTLGIYLLIVGVLMVTRLRFVHVANRLLGGRKRFTTLVVVLFAMVLLFERPVEFLFFAFNGYVIVSLIDNARLRLSRREPTAATTNAGPERTPARDSLAPEPEKNMDGLD